MRAIIASIILFFACLVRAENHMVTVGQGGLVYNPTSVNANAGDTIEFVVTGVTFLSSSFPPCFKSAKSSVDT
jgi:plastocyanin